MDNIHKKFHSTLFYSVPIYSILVLQPSVWPWALFQFLNLNTDGRTPWTGDQHVARPLPTHRTTQTQNTHTDIHVSSGIQTHDPSVRARKDISYLRQRTLLFSINKKYSCKIKYRRIRQWEESGNSTFRWLSLTLSPDIVEINYLCMYRSKLQLQ
jgi:hypothetical protein